METIVPSAFNLNTQINLIKFARIFQMYNNFFLIENRIIILRISLQDPSKDFRNKYVTGNG